MSITTQSWEKFPILTRPDGSFVITVNGNPYHVPKEQEGEFAPLWQAVAGFVKENPGQATPEPVPPSPDPVALRLSEIQAELDTIDRQTARPERALRVAAIMGLPESETDKERLVALEERAGKLREEMHEIQEAQNG